MLLPRLLLLLTLSLPQIVSVADVSSRSFLDDHDPGSDGRLPTILLDGHSSSPVCNCHGPERRLVNDQEEEGDQITEDGEGFRTRRHSKTKKVIRSGAWVMGVFLLLLPAAVALAVLAAVRGMFYTGCEEDFIDSNYDGFGVVVEKDILPVSGCFMDPSKEIRFVYANSGVVCDNTMIITTWASLYSFYHSMFSYDIFANTVWRPTYRKWDSNARVVYNFSWISILILSLVTCALMRYYRNHWGRRYAERLLAAWAFFSIELMQIPGNRFSSASLFHEDPRTCFTHFEADAAMMVNFIAVILFIVLYTPIRFCIFGPMCVSVAVLFPIQKIWLGSPDGKLWLIAFGYPAPRFLGEMCTMDISTATWFATIMFMIMMGQRKMERKRRKDFSSLEESAKLIEELQNEDAASKGSSQLQRAVDALNSVESALKELETNRYVVKGKLGEDLQRLQKNIQVAQKTLKNADRLFHVDVKDVFETKEFEQYKDDKVIHGFAAMTGAANDRRESYDIPGGKEMTAVPSRRSLDATTVAMGRNRFTQAPSKASGNLIHMTDPVVMDCYDSVGSDWGVDLFELARKTGNCCLLHVGELFIVKALWRGALVKENVDEETLRQFVREIHKRYPQNEYHNEVHAAYVMHMALWFGTETGYVYDMANDLERSSLMIAACCHDVGHIGRNNLFLVNSKHSAAMMWNDSAVLENMHSSICFNVSEREGCKIFEGCPFRDRASFRKNIIDLILATDLKSHNESIAKFSARCEAEDFLKTPGAAGGDTAARWQADKLMLAKMIMQSSDIGHAGLPWNLHREASFRCVCEFFAQGDEEKRLGLPVSPLCERRDYNIVNNQGFFIDFIARSCLIQLEKTAEGDGKIHITEEVLAGCDENKSQWKLLYSNGEFDPMNFDIRICEPTNQPPTAPKMPYEYDHGSNPMVRVANETVLSEVSAYRKQARSIDSKVILPNLF